MAQVTLFHYSPGRSLFHTIDPRIKLITLLFFCISVMASRFPCLVLLIPVVAASALAARLRVKQLANELRFFFLFLLIIFLIRAYSETGDPLFRWEWLCTPTLPGMIEASLLVTRLLVIILLSLILTTTTKITDLHEAVYALLRPIPFIPAARIATMMSLTILFVPTLLDQYGDIVDAAKSRCIDKKKNPINRIVTLIRPLLINIFNRADDIASAMEARCYSEDRIPPEFRMKARDWIFLVCSITLGTCTFILNIIIE
jgi:energy-coupling factor transporter transmembrane protein EcfT